jgi:hypothetical protein
LRFEGQPLKVLGARCGLVASPAKRQRETRRKRNFSFFVEPAKFFFFHRDAAEEEEEAAAIEAFAADIAARARYV